MDPGRGLAHYINFGKETTNGTPVTPTRSLRIIGESLVLDQPPLISEDLSDDYHSVDEVHFGMASASGDVIVEANFTGEELFWHDLLGTYDFTAATPGAGQHTHKFWNRPDSTNDFIPGLTIEKTLGLTGASNQMQFYGMHVTKLVQELDPLGFLKHTWSFAGRGQSAVSAAAASFPARLKIRAAQAVTVQVGAASAKLYGAQVTWERPRDTERKHYGGANVREALINERPTCVMTGELEWSDSVADEAADLYELFRSQSSTVKPVLVNWVGPTLSGGTYVKTLSIGQCKVMGSTPVASGRGIIRMNVEMRNVGTGANAPYVLYVNATSAKVTT